MSGFQAPYTPGWDNHGMPIESAIIKQNKLDRKKMSIPEFRNACRDFAGKFVDVQREKMKRLGTLGDWDRPYPVSYTHLDVYKRQMYASEEWYGTPHMGMRSSGSSCDLSLIHI